MKDKIHRLATTVQTELASANRLREVAAAFIDRKARLQSETTQLIEGHDFSIDPKTCAKLAALQAGSALVEQCTPRLLALMNAALDCAINVSATLRNGIKDIHRELDTLIEESLLAAVPEDLRDGVDVLGASKEFRAEVVAREAVGSVPGFDRDAREDLSRAVANLGHFADYFGRCAAELTRCEGVAARFAKA